MDYDEFEIKFVELIGGFVSKSSPEDIHRMILTWNFDNPKMALTSVAENPKTDKGTALMLYWLMVPGYAKQFTDRTDVIKQDRKWYPEDFDIIENIEKKYLAGFYT